MKEKRKRTRMREKHGGVEESRWKNEEGKKKKKGEKKKKNTTKIGGGWMRRVI